MGSLRVFSVSSVCLTLVLIIRRPLRSTLFPYTTLFRSLRRVLVAIAGLQFQATTDNHTQDARNAIVELTGGQSAFLGALHQTLQRAVRRVRHLAGQQLVEDQSRAVNVRLDIDRLSLRLLWRHVLRRPDKSTCERQSVATLHSRQAEIHH